MAGATIISPFWARAIMPTPMPMAAGSSPWPKAGSACLSDPDARVVRRGPDRAMLTPQVRAFLSEPSPLIITKSNERSRIHRHVHMDYVGVKMFDAEGKLTGERRFVGLFTSGAYSRRPQDIPLLRLKVQHVAERAGLPPASHDGKALAHILDTYPRDELFQVTEDELFATAMGILRLGERPEGARVPALRPLRPFRLRARLSCRATATTPPRAKTSTRSSPRPSTAACRRPRPCSTNPCSRACITSSAATTARARMSMCMRWKHDIAQGHPHLGRRLCRAR